MPGLELSRDEFRRLTAQLLAGGHGVRFQAGGESMRPFICSGDILEVVPVHGYKFQLGDVLLVETGEGRLLVHRVVRTRWSDGVRRYLVKGDACASPDGWFSAQQVLGKVTAVERRGQRADLTSRSQKVKSWLWAACTPFTPAFRWLPAGVKNWLKHLLMAA